MKVIKPVPVTDAVYSASNIPEPDLSMGEVLWNDRNLTPTFGSYSGRYITSTLANDGFIYCVGQYVNEVLKINPTTKSVTKFGSYSGDYFAAALGGDGNIYCIGSAGNVMKIDIPSQSVSIIGSYPSTSLLNNTATLANDGNIYCVGQGIGDDPSPVIKINVASQTVSSFGSYTRPAISSSYQSATLANDGNIYCIGDSGDVMKISVLTQSLSKISSFEGNYLTSELGSDGNIYFIGNTGSVLMINILTQSVNEAATHSPGTYKSSQLGVDGKIYCTGFESKTISIDTVSGTTQELNSDDSGVYLASSIISDGTILFVGDSNALEIKPPYQPDEKAILTSNHKEYQVLLPNRTNPEDGIKKVPPEWVEVKTTNKFALVDTKVFSPSISSTPITISLTPGEMVDSVAAFELVNVTTVDISAVSAASGSVYNNTITIDGYPEFVDMDIPPFDDLTITVTFNGSDIEVGEVVTGLAYDIGKLLVGVQDATKDYSRQEFDEFGNLEFVKRPIVNQTTYPIAVAKDQAFNVKRLLNSLRGTAAVWVGDTGGGFLLTTYGYVERAPMVYDNQSVVKYQIKVRGSI